MAFLLSQQADEEPMIDCSQMSGVAAVCKDDECAICQEPYRDPTRLRCAHVFCEGCVAEWFDRDERTCPLCRAVVVDGVGSRAGDAHRDGGTNMFAHAF